MEWVNINDGLPIQEGHYLCYCPGSFTRNYRGVIAEFYMDNKKFYGECTEEVLEDVKYWSELPKLPKDFNPHKS